jgi:hypothetical protein
MLRRTLTALVLCLAAAGAAAQTLPLPDTLIDLRSDAGETLLHDSEATAAFTPLVSNFITQKTQSYCGVASMVMVLNALQLPAPVVPEYDPYRTFTQDNLLDAASEAIRPQATILERGMTLDQLGAILDLHAIAKVDHAEDTTLEDFRDKARAALSTDGQFVIVNYLRSAIGQEKFGHISPLGAYDADTDRFLILDVSRYKYPPVWVEASVLFAAMNTPDSDNDNRSRGFVRVRPRSD